MGDGAFGEGAPANAHDGEAAAYLGTTVRHLRRLVSDHELSRYKVGGRNRFADVDRDAWLDGRRIAGSPLVTPRPGRGRRPA